MRQLSNLVLSRAQLKESQSNKEFSPLSIHTVTYYTLCFMINCDNNSDYKDVVSDLYNHSNYKYFPYIAADQNEIIRLNRHVKRGRIDYDSVDLSEQLTPNDQLISWIDQLLDENLFKLIRLAKTHKGHQNAKSYVLNGERPDVQLNDLKGVI